MIAMNASFALTTDTGFLLERYPDGKITVRPYAIAASGERAFGHALPMEEETLEVLREILTP